MTDSSTVPEKALDIFRILSGYGYDILPQVDVSCLFEPWIKYGVKIKNHIAIHPMEGCDSNENGAPSELTFRRYKRFAEGGAGLIWLEAVAVCPEGRANPRQLCINEKNVGEFAKLVAEIKKAAQPSPIYGDPFVICQLTHSGRQSRPYSEKKLPLIAAHIPLYEKDAPLPESCILSDSQLAEIPYMYEKAARLAKEAGFDGVDVKSCHGYLFAELAAKFRNYGDYGGTFENRMRLLFDSVSAVDRAVCALPGDLLLCGRIGVYDAIENGFGVGYGEDGELLFDETEPIAMLKGLKERGMKLIDITMGNPYFNPHINRPYKSGGYVPPEPPERGVARLLSGSVSLYERSGIPMVTTGYSWLGEYAPYFAAGVIKKYPELFFGMGRNSIAYPYFPSDLFKNGAFDRKKTCVACGKCTELMRAGGVSGCPVRDREVYFPIYKELCLK